MRIWLRALGTFIVITLMGLLMDRLMLTEGIPRLDLLLISNALVGAVAAVLVIAWTVQQRQRAAFVSSRMRVIAEMNHHIRNALQVIQFSARNQKNDDEVKAMREAVQRITWALREVLPQMLNAEDELPVSDVKERPKLEVEYRRPPAVNGR
jgi:hypothetical protein